MAGPTPPPAARFWVVSGWVRGLRSCCGAAASVRLDHRRSGVAHTRPHRAGFPVTGPAVVVSIHVRPVRAAEALQSPAASCRLGSRCEPPHGRRHPCRRPSMPGGNGARCRRRQTGREAATLGTATDAGSCRRRARTRFGWSVGGGADAASCGSVLGGLRSGARLEILLWRRRLHAARPSWVRRCSYAPASCGLPCDWSCGGCFYSCAAHPGRRGSAIAGGILPPRFSLRTTNRSAASMPPTFNAGWERVALVLDA